jgi:hypothetical protein
MTDCNNCFHYSVCFNTDSINSCVDYTPKERVKVLPCEEGTAVYRIVKYYNIACEARFGIEKAKFNLSMLYQVYNTPLFDKNTSLEDTYFLTEEEAREKMEEIIND